MARKKGKKKSYQMVVLTNPETNYRIVLRKNNYANKKKLAFKKYCPLKRQRFLFKETAKERHLS